MKLLLAIAMWIESNNPNWPKKEIINAHATNLRSPMDQDLFQRLKRSRKLIYADNSPYLVVPFKISFDVAVLFNLKTCSFGLCNKATQTKR